MIEEIIQAVAANDAKAAATQVRILSLAAEAGRTATFLADTATALETGNWAPLTPGFHKKEFIRDDGTFLLIGPYTVRRQGKEVTTLSALYGEVIPHDSPPFEETALLVFGELRQSVPRVIPVRVHAGAGQFGHEEASEAFVVPDGWAFSESDGPAINNMDEQRRRFSESLTTCMNNIFDSATASLLLDPLRDAKQGIQIQHLEFQVHDAGHATGIGLKAKLSLGLLSNTWFRAVEEWRADGVANEIASRCFSLEAFADIIASNFCIRFGLDAHRAGGVERDQDADACLLTFAHLLKSGMFAIGADGKLRLLNPTKRGLVDATALMRASAVALTRKELQAEYPQAIAYLFGSFYGVDDATRMLFTRTIIDPCRGVYDELA